MIRERCLRQGDVAVTEKKVDAGWIWKDEPDFVGCGGKARAPQVKAEWPLSLLGASRASHC